MATYFITQQYLVSNGFINGNVDTNIYKSLIEFSAKAYIKPQIGSYWFNILYTKYNNQTLTADETLVVEIMQKAIAFRVKAQTALDASYQLTSKGIVRQSDDNATAADSSEVSFVYDHNIAHAKLFELELKDFLITNKELYPDFTDALNKDSQIKNSCCKGGGDSYNESGLFFI